jgi:hypothetical protein
VPSVVKREDKNKKINGSWPLKKSSFIVAGNI